MTAWGRFVDKPKLALTDCVLLIVGYLSASVLLIWRFPGWVPMAFYFFITSSYRLYYLINTMYELTNSQLKIRSGFYKKDISLESITGVRFNRSRRYFSVPGKQPPLVKIRNKVFLVGPNVMITPENPAVFIEGLKKRIPKLEIGGISSAYKSQNAEALYKRLLDLYMPIWGSRLGSISALEREIKSYIKNGFNREDAIRKIAEWEFEAIPS